MTEPEDETTEKRVILRFYIGMQYDARTHVMYAYAPSDWNEWDEEKRAQFLEDEAANWMNNQLEWGAEVYTGEQYNPWEQGGWSGEPEEVFD